MTAQRTRGNGTALRSRRVVLGAALGAVAATVTKGVAAPGRSLATDDGAVLHVGDSYTDVTKLTQLVNTSQGTGVLNAVSTGGAAIAAYSTNGHGVSARSANAPGLYAESSGATNVAALVRNVARGCGVVGISDQGAQSLPSVSATGVYGIAYGGPNTRGVTGEVKSGRGINGIATTGYAVYGTAETGTGVYGTSTGGVGVHGVSVDADGVHGESTNANAVSGTSAGGIASGVYGENTAGGIGVAGRCGTGVAVAANTDTGIAVNALAQNGGVAVLATSIGGTALKVKGRVLFTTAGLSTVPVGAKGRVIAPGTDLVATSTIICTLESNQAGLFLQRVVKNTIADSFAVYLSAAVAAGRTAKIGWFVIG